MPGQRRGVEAATSPHLGYFARRRISWLRDTKYFTNVLDDMDVLSAFSSKAKNMPFYALRKSGLTTYASRSPHTTERLTQAALREVTVDCGRNCDDDYRRL